MIKPKAATPISVQDEHRAAEILGRVRRMEVRTNRLVDDSLAGRYASVFKGRGMDFDRVRNYVPGDDVRTIDWNVTARTGDPHVKLFTEERELTILLMIDVSASSDFGRERRSTPSLRTSLLKSGSSLVYRVRSGHAIAAQLAAGARRAGPGILGACGAKHAVVNATRASRRDAVASCLG